MRLTRYALLLPVLWTSTLVAADHSDTTAGPTPDQAYQQLMDGHARYTSGTRTLPHQDENRRCETTTGGQHPVAAVLSCADSRVPPELLFDQGIGDLFVIRVAGNVAAADELGTLEYGVEHLNIPLIVVLGHTKCGAVTAVVDGAHAEGNLAELLEPIAPAAARARQLHPTYKGPQLVASAIQENVRQSIKNLSARSPLLAKAIAGGKVKVVGGVYDIHAGQITWLDSATSLAAAEPAREEPAAHEPAHAEPAPAAHAAAEPASHEAHEADTHAAAEPAVTHGPAKASHAAAEPAEDAHEAAVEQPKKLAHAAAKPAAHAEEAEHDETPAAHGKPKTEPKAAAHEEADEHEAKPTASKAVKADKTEAASASASLLSQWPILTGVAVASTLIGAAITRFAPK